MAHEAHIDDADLHHPSAHDDFVCLRRELDEQLVDPDLSEEQVASLRRVQAWATRESERTSPQPAAAMSPATPSRAEDAVWMAGGLVAGVVASWVIGIITVIVLEELLGVRFMPQYDGAKGELGEHLWIMGHGVVVGGVIAACLSDRAHDAWGEFNDRRKATAGAIVLIWGHQIMRARQALSAVFIALGAVIALGGTAAIAHEVWVAEGSGGTVGAILAFVFGGGITLGMGGGLCIAALSAWSEARQWHRKHECAHCQQDAA